MISPQIFAALPVMNEPLLMASLNSLLKQDYSDFMIYICVNQPENDRFDRDKKYIYEQNQHALSLLHQLGAKQLHIIDRSSEGHGWQPPHIGVGMARKTLMDEISVKAQPQDIIISVDADTFYPSDYFSSVAEKFRQYPQAVGLANPYYHKLTGDEPTDRAILRYELYMRYYAFHLKRIRSPYAFTPLGSAMAAPVWAYRKVGGLTPVKSGEDFYFLQKLSKTGPLITQNQVTVFPAARFSNRVFFGTGPAMIKGAQGLWDSYPFYEEKYFDEVKMIFEQFDEAYEKDIDCPVLDIQTLHKFRKQAKNKAYFLKFCHEKFDGLRTLQYLKSRQNTQTTNDHLVFCDFVRKYFPDYSFFSSEIIDFSKTPVHRLDEIRNVMFSVR